MALRAIVILLLLAATAVADVVVMKDGRILRGEVVRESRYRLVLRTQVDGVWTDVEIARRDVKDSYGEPGHQADTPPVTPRAADPVETPASSPRPTDGSLVAIVPLHGQVGGLLDGSVTGTFDAELLRVCLDRAAADGAAVVVLDVDSPGGYLVEMEDICSLIIERSGTQRIVAWPREAMSAAAIVTLTCPELVVRPDSLVGAAVMILRDADGEVNAVDAKRASPHHARQREFMAASGRPYPLLAAMSIQDVQLWWSPTRGFIDSVETAAATPDARHVDGDTTVLTMTATDAVDWAVAAARVSDRDDLALALGLDDARFVEYDALVRDHNIDINRRLGVVLQQFGAYFQALGGLESALGRLEDSSGDTQDTRRIEADVRRLVNRTRTAGKAIEGQDRRLFARRADLPDGLMEQIERDASVLRDVPDQARDPAALPRARRSVQQILDRWRQLLSLGAP